MVAKKKATTGTRGVKKLKLKRETLKDLDVSRGKRIKGGGALQNSGRACPGVSGRCGGQTLGCVGQTLGCGADSVSCGCGGLGGK